MSPAGRDASVAPDSIAALSCSVVTDRSWMFAGTTLVHNRKLFSRIAINGKKGKAGLDHEGGDDVTRLRRPGPLL